MPSKPFVALSSPVALGATLLGVSASLLALDVTGTVLLDRIRSADAAPATVAAAPAAAASMPSTLANVAAPSKAGVPRAAAPHTAVAPRIAAAPLPHVFSLGATTPEPSKVAPRSVAASLAGSPAQPAGAMPARHESVANAARRAPSPAAAVVVAHAWRATHTIAPAWRATHAIASVPRPTHVVAPEPAAVTRRPLAARRVVVALQAPPPSPPARNERAVASLRDVRRFVIRKLRARDHRVCAISATAYNASDGYVVVDLVVRDGKTRWSEKAVVRRNGTDLKLLSAKARALPYWTVASSGVIPRR